MRRFRRVVLLGAVVAAVVAISQGVPAAYVLAPLVGLGILRFGLATFGSLRTGASYIPDGPPQPVDPAVERTTYWCAGCGAELLLLVRGTETAPRHCGERMAARTEVARGTGA
jgi:DNA-directed RNA polymerase subunit RPC12/RpoP